MPLTTAGEDLTIIPPGCELPEERTCTGIHGVHVFPAAEIDNAVRYRWNITPRPLS